MNIAKLGVIPFTIDVRESSIVDGATVASLFNGALFQLRVASSTYSVLTQGTVVDGIIHVSIRMSDELKTILSSKTTATSAANAPEIALELLATANGGNYLLKPVFKTRLFYSTK